MKNTDWVRVTPCDSIPLREGRVVSLDGHEIAVFNLGGRFLAIENHCPHRGGPLADGIVTGDKVVCPLHARKVCLKTGSMEAKGVEAQPDASACVQTYPVRIQDGHIDLQVPAWNEIVVPLQAEVCSAEVA